MVGFHILHSSIKFAELAGRFYRDACGMTDFKDAPAHPLFANAKAAPQ